MLRFLAFFLLFALPAAAQDVTAPLGAGGGGGGSAAKVASDCQATVVPGRTHCYDTTEEALYFNPTTSPISDGTGLTGAYAEIPDLTLVSATDTLPGGTCTGTSCIHILLDGSDTPIGLYCAVSGESYTPCSGSDALLATCDTGAPVVDNAGEPACGPVLTRDLSDSAWTGRMRAANLPSGTVAGQPLVSSGSGDPGYGVPSMRALFDFRDDFCAGNVSASSGVSFGGWHATVSNGGTAFDPGATNKFCVGRVQTTGAGYSILRLAYGGTAAGTYTLQGGETFTAKVARYGTSVDASGDEINLIVGLCDTTDASGAAFDCTDGVFWLFDPDNSTGYGANNANWWLILEAGGTFTATDSGVAATDISGTGSSASFQRLSFTVASDKSSLTASVDATPVVPASFANLPTAPTLPMLGAGRTDFTAGTKFLAVDYVQWHSALAVAR